MSKYVTTDISGIVQESDEGFLNQNEMLANLSSVCLLIGFQQEEMLWVSVY